MGLYDEKYLWRVPSQDMEGPGILLSDRIAFYADLVKLIEPIDEGCLRPACYDLKVGDSYYIDDRLEKIGENGIINIPPNGVVYVKIHERFNLPYYIMARYGLRVAHVYRGLFVDNGLQIDPGYHGYIHAVVHNLMNQERVLKKGEPFLSVEFARTAAFNPAGVSDVSSERELIGKHPLHGLAGRSLVTFARTPSDLGVSREPTYFRRPGEVNSPATFEMRKRIADLEAAGTALQKQIDQRAGALERNMNKATAALRRTVSRFQKVSVVGGFAVLITVLYWLSDRYSELVKDAAEARSLSQRALTTVQDEKDKQAARETLKTLQDRVTVLEQSKR